MATALPVGRVTVRAVPGGMLVDTGTHTDPMLIALAAVLVSVES